MVSSTMGPWFSAPFYENFVGSFGGTIIEIIKNEVFVFLFPNTLQENMLVCLSVCQTNLPFYSAHDFRSFLSFDSDNYQALFKPNLLQDILMNISIFPALRQARNSIKEFQNYFLVLFSPSRQY